MLKTGLGSYHWVLENSMRLTQDNAENHLIKHQLTVQVRTENMVLYSILWESGMGQKCGGQGFFFWTERWASQVQPAEAKLEPQSGEGWLSLAPYSPWVSGFLLLPKLGSQSDPLCQQMISNRNLPGFIFLSVY